MPDPRPVVVDTDPGIDDAVALALAAWSPGIEVVGVTTTYGNLDLRRTSRNARHILDLAGASRVPVVPGADRPLRGQPPSDAGRHGPEGVGRASVGPAPSVQANPGALFELLLSLRASVTLLALGPLTNLAHALERDVTLVRRRVHRVTAVFGDFGTATGSARRADFNARCDPEATALVLSSALPLTILPLDVATRFTLKRQDVESWQCAADPLLAWLGAAVVWKLEAGDEGAASLPDVVAVASLVDPRVLTLAKRRLSIDLDEGPARGHTRERADGTAAVVAASVQATCVRSLVLGMARPGRAAGTGEDEL